MHRRGRDKDKFGARSRDCIFVGYLFGKKTWRFYDTETNEFFISRDAVFFEDQFPGIPSTVSVTPPKNIVGDDMDEWLLPVTESRGSLPTSHISPVSAPLPTTTTVSTPATETVMPLPSTTESSPSQDTTPPSESLPSEIAHVVLPSTADSTTPSRDHVPLVPSPVPASSTSFPSPGLLEVLGRAHRAKKSSVLLKNFVTHSAINPPPHPHPPPSRLICLFSLILNYGLR